MAEKTITRRAALAGSVALPMIPTVAVASVGPIESKLGELRRRASCFEAADEGDAQLYDWMMEPMVAIDAMMPTTLRELAAKIEAHAVASGLFHPFEEVAAAGLSDDARAILGQPAAPRDVAT